MATLKDVQLKILHKIESKDKRALAPHVVRRYFEPFDKDRDGSLTVLEFQNALEMLGSPVSAGEADFLFHIWDTMADTREAAGQVEVELIVQDLLSSMPTYGTGFNSGAESLKTNKGGRGNLPSQAGGIFEGGSYAADSRNELAPKAPPAQAGGYVATPMAVNNRPKGNQSSIPGGIFGGMDEGAAPPPPSANAGRSNRSNQSSIQGGIFGEAAPMAPPPRNQRNSNQSSIPGGIFG